MRHNDPPQFCSGNNDQQACLKSYFTDKHKIAIKCKWAGGRCTKDAECAFTPTAAPTSSPTPKPTPKPTPSPTPPTSTPTANPTPPTANPTTAPTRAPTLSCTDEPNLVRKQKACFNDWAIPDNCRMLSYQEMDFMLQSKLRDENTLDYTKEEKEGPDRRVLRKSGSGFSIRMHQLLKAGGELNKKNCGKEVVDMYESMRQDVKKERKTRSWRDSDNDVLQVYQFHNGSPPGITVVGGYVPGTPGMGSCGMDIDIVNKFKVPFQQRCNAIYVTLMAGTPAHCVDGGLMKHEWGTGTCTASGHGFLTGHGEQYPKRWAAFQVLQCTNAESNKTEIKGKATTVDGNNGKDDWCNGKVKVLAIDTAFRQVLSEIRFIAGQKAAQYGPNWSDVVENELKSTWIPAFNNETKSAVKQACKHTKKELQNKKNDQALDTYNTVCREKFKCEGGECDEPVLITANEARQTVKNLTDVDGDLEFPFRPIGHDGKMYDDSFRNYRYPGRWDWNVSTSWRPSRMACTEATCREWLRSWHSCSCNCNAGQNKSGCAQTPLSGQHRRRSGDHHWMWETNWPSVCPSPQFECQAMSMFPCPTGDPASSSYDPHATPSPTSPTASPTPAPTRAPTPILCQGRTIHTNEEGGHGHYCAQGWSGKYDQTKCEQGFHGTVGSPAGEAYKKCKWDGSTSQCIKGDDCTTKT